MNSQCLSYSYSNEKLDIMTHHDDEIFLVKKAALGEQSAFAVLVSKYREKLYRIIFFMVHHEEDALDLLLDCFIKAYQALPKLKNPAIFNSWIIKISVNLSINHIKKKKRLFNYKEELINNANFPKIKSPPMILEQKETTQQLFKLINKLPPKQKSVLILCDIEGLSYKEIAEILQCRIGTIMSRLYYARDFIRNNI